MRGAEREGEPWSGRRKAGNVVSCQVIGSENTKLVYLFYPCVDDIGEYIYPDKDGQVGKVFKWKRLG